MKISKLLLNRRVIGLYHDYENQSLRILFEDDFSIVFNGCALIFDLGIIGHRVAFISESATLGMTLELKKIKKDLNVYKYLLLSRDINDIKNKNELLISYKYLELGDVSVC